ncbi:PAS domain S-box protein [Pseudomonas batumici]|uniref:Aerotaxis sensor receptor protein n=1 Tax=Pseudomonas batumici TaxID=226910 RepID=A0A0C2EW88_9PSED|nr:Aerotaxis sensor receptor protein [Pseudomonas batumici]
MRQNLPVTGRNLELPQDANILSTTDTQSFITYVNSDFIKISGFTEAELQGQSHNIVRHPDMPAAAFEHMWATLKAGRSWMRIPRHPASHSTHIRPPVPRSSGQAVGAQRRRFALLV